MNPLVIALIIISLRLGDCKNIVSYYFLLRHPEVIGEEGLQLLFPTDSKSIRRNSIIYIPFENTLTLFEHFECLQAHFRNFSAHDKF